MTTKVTSITIDNYETTLNAGSNTDYAGGLFHFFDENDDDANMTFLWTSDMDSPNIICFDNPDDVTDIIMDIQDSEYDVYQSYNVGVRTFSKPYH